MFYSKLKIFDFVIHFYKFKDDKEGRTCQIRDVWAVSSPNDAFLGVNGLFTAQQTEMQCGLPLKLQSHELKCLTVKIKVQHVEFLDAQFCASLISFTIQDSLSL